MPAQSVEKIAPNATFLGRYEVAEKVGEGGFGIVYKAHQLTTGQSVAIKVLRIPEDCPKERLDRLVARFQREMRLCARLHHPNIVRLMDSGRADDRDVYAVFEFVPGKNLATVLATEQRLLPVEARHLMIQILDALACAHASGVVHRDLKPANIMVVPTGARRNAVVLDFGIGTLIEDARPDEAQITHSNEWIGSPAYAAPEQLRGQRPSPRSDLYAWGLVFLECLTGERVVRGATMADTVWKQLSPEPIPIPERIAAHPLGHILKRVTQKDARARDLSAEGLLRELEACDVSGLDLDGGSSDVRSPSTFEPTMTLEKRPTPGSQEALAAASAPSAADRSSVEGQRRQITGLRQVEGERRQITAVCCALSMVSEKPGDIDADEIDPVLGAEQEACTAIARRFGGQIGGALSDTTLFLFGYPSAREDDAPRAARAALAMAAEVRGRSAAIAASHNARVEIRVGVHTGLIVTRDLVTSGDRMPSHLGGATPQMATKLSALAEPGEVLTSGETYRLLRGHFALEGRGPIAVAGAPAFVYRVHEGHAAVESRDVPLVGREQDLDALLERWSRARGGNGQAVLITGEPGIGKSRLTRALRERLGAEAHTYLEGRCSQDATNSPLYSIIDVLSRLLDPSGDRSTEARTERLMELLSSHGFDLDEAMPLFAPLLSLPLPAPFSPLDMSPQKQRTMTRDAVLSLLFAMGERAPVVLLVEDMHWADPSTLELCAELVSEVSSSRVYVLFTGRPELSPPWPPEAALTMTLGHLDRSDVARMAAALSGSRSLPKEAVDRIAARTDGVPLFVEELLQMMLESGALVERDGAFVLTDTLDGPGIPSTLRDLLAARLDRLGRVKESAQVASAIGREFDFDLLRAVLAAEEGALREDLDKLMAVGLVYRDRQLRSAPYVFKHALIRDAAYESLPKPNRWRLHKHIAETLESHSPRVVTDRPELLAHHYTEAKLVEQAIPYWQQAGQRASGQSANLEAIQHFERALGLLPTLPDTLARASQELGLQLPLTAAHMSTQGYAAPVVGTICERARELCDKLGDSRQLFPVLWGLCAFGTVRGDLDPAVELSARALGIAEKEMDPALLVPAHLLHGGSNLWLGNFVEARGHFERGLSFYNAEEHSVLASVYSYDPGSGILCYLALDLWLLGYPDQAIESARAAVAQARATGHVHSYVHNLMRATQVALLREESGPALEDIRSLLAVSEDKGFPLWRAYGLCLRGQALSQEGHVIQGIEDLQAGIQASLDTGATVEESVYFTALAEAFRKSGQLEKALETVADALKTMAKTNVRFYEAELYRLQGDLILESVSTTAGEAHAEESLRKSIEIARRSHAKSWEIRAAMSLARLWKSQGRRAAARDLLRDSYGWFTEGLDTPPLKSAQMILDELS